MKMTRGHGGNCLRCLLEVGLSDLTVILEQTKGSKTEGIFSQQLPVSRYQAKFSTTI